MFETKRFETMLANILSFTYHFRLHTRRKTRRTAERATNTCFFLEEKFKADCEGEEETYFFIA